MNYWTKHAKELKDVEPLEIVMEKVFQVKYTMEDDGFSVQLICKIYEEGHFVGRYEIELNYDCDEELDEDCVDSLPEVFLTVYDRYGEYVWVETFFDEEVIKACKKGVEYFLNSLESLALERLNVKGRLVVDTKSKSVYDRYSQSFKKVIEWFRRFF